MFSSLSIFEHFCLFRHTYISILPIFGIQILLYKILTKNSSFSSFAFILFGFISYLFFSIQSILLSFILWEFITWVSYILLKTEHNQSQTRTILLNNIIGGLTFAWAACILMQKCTLWIDLQHAQFTHNEILQITIALCITILTKSSQFPFSWLMLTEKSSSLVSAYLHSSTIVQMGLYLILQIHNSQIDNTLLYYILSISCFITLLKSCFYFRTSNLKILVSLTSQMHVSLCILTALYNHSDLHSLKYIIFAHALYKSFMFVFCDEIFKENGNYNIENIKTLSYSSFALLFLCIIPMCGIPGFEITYMYGKVHLISSILVKSTNILLFFKLFKQMHQTQFTKLQIKHIIFFPCIIFLLPSTITIIKICYLILYILIALLLHAILQQYRLCKNFNFTNIIGYIRKIPAPQSMQNVKKTIYIYLLLFGILNIAIFNPQFLYNLLAHFKFNYNEMHFLFLLLFGCFLLLYKGLPSKLAGLLLISIYMTNEYIKFGGVDIAVTNIIVDIIITYLIIKSKINFNVNKQSIPGSIFSFLHSMLLAICLISCFKIPSKIVQYPANTTVNDIVVHYRVLDTLGETLTLLVIAYAIQLISNRKKHH